MRRVVLVAFAVAGIAAACGLSTAPYPVDVSRTPLAPTTPAQVQQVIGAWIAANEQQHGRAVEPRILKMVWLPPNTEVGYSAAGGLGGDTNQGGYGSGDEGMWLIDVEGTLVYPPGTAVHKHGLVWLDGTTLRIRAVSPPS